MLSIYREEILGNNFRDLMASQHGFKIGSIMDFFKLLGILPSQIETLNKLVPDRAIP